MPRRNIRRSTTVNIYSVTIVKPRRMIELGDIGEIPNYHSVYAPALATAISSVDAARNCSFGVGCLKRS